MAKRRTLEGASAAKMLPLVAFPNAASASSLLRKLGDIAQLGEHQLCKLGVTGSIPVISTRHELVRLYTR